VVGPALLDYTINGNSGRRDGNRRPDAAPHGAFQCRSRPRTPQLDGLNPNPQFPPDLMAPEEERWCVITAFDEAQWQALKAVMGHPGWVEQECFATLAGRKANEDALERYIGDWTCEQDADELAARLQATGVPAHAVQTAEDMLDRDEHIRERGYYVYLDHPDTGRSAYDGVAFKMSGTPGGPVRPAPLLGEHTYYVANEIMGLSSDEIAELTAAGVLQ
jgi:crotonobetainyl-CoA:carnitine CoA-transferase CaiB-like acyl-CoA transferase